MEKNQKIKKIAYIVIAALTSGYFLFSGFTMLLSEDANNEQNSSMGVIDINTSTN